MDSKELTEALTNIQNKLNEIIPCRCAPEKAPEQSKIEQATSLIDKIKDNIAYIVGLPATLGGAFGFLWDSSAEEAELTHKVMMLEEAVAGLKAENDLLGGGTKNFSIDMSSAPSGSLTVIVVAGVIAVAVGFLVVYQKRRRNRS